MGIYFDMDGTIADLYGVDDWLKKLRAEDASPYAEARPLVNLSRLARLLHKAQRNGYKVGVISWTSKNGSETYNAEVTVTKTKWLGKHLPSVKWDEIKIVAYGTPKSKLGSGILFDDEAPNRADWGESAFEPSQIFEILRSL